MRHPNTSGMKQIHWDALQTYCNGTFQWDGQKLCWRVVDNNRFVFYGKKLFEAVEQMVEQNKELNNAEQ